MYFSATNRIGLKGEAYRSYFSAFSIFLGGGTKIIHFVTPEHDRVEVAQTEEDRLHLLVLLLEVLLVELRWYLVAGFSFRSEVF